MKTYDDELISYDDELISQENMSRLEAEYATYNPKAESKETNSRFQAPELDTVKSKFDYADLILGNREAYDYATITEAIDLLEKVANDPSDKSQSKARLLFGYELKERDPQLAEAHLQRIKNHNELSGEACQLLAYIYQNPNYKDLYNTTKAAAYYAIAYIKGFKDLTGCNRLLATLRNSDRTMKTDQSHFAYQILRCQYEEQLISIASYVTGLREIISCTDESHGATTRRLCGFEVLKAWLTLARDNGDLGQLQLAGVYAREIAAKLDYRGTPEKNKAMKLANEIDHFSEPPKASEKKNRKGIGTILAATKAKLTSSKGSETKTSPKPSISEFAGQLLMIANDGCPGVSSNKQGLSNSSTYSTLPFTVPSSPVSYQKATEEVSHIQTFSSPKSDSSEFAGDLLKFTDDECQKTNSNKQELSNSSTYSTLPQTFFSPINNTANQSVDVNSKGWTKFYPWPNLSSELEVYSLPPVPKMSSALEEHWVPNVFNLN